MPKKQGYKRKPVKVGQEVVAIQNDQPIPLGVELPDGTLAIVPPNDWLVDGVVIPNEAFRFLFEVNQVQPSDPPPPPPVT